ncbi:hypothetical protein IFR04_010474 [Cadophora malorum]|uniref:DUF7025 domain-containing protein n=1 Tax=Cadophora malorum TaxID=108018 RepID=A0A8H7W8Q5_9HELO|nr:hypothetical protein IFR04_010474 [Cadophora malorum]
MSTTEINASQVQSRTRTVHDTSGLAVTAIQYDTILGGALRKPPASDDHLLQSPSLDAPEHTPDQIHPLEIKNLIEIPRDRGYTGEVRVLSIEGYRKRRRGRDDPNEPFKDFPIVVRRVLDHLGHLQDIRLEVQSEALRNVLKEIAGLQQDEINLNGDPIVIRTPFMPLYFIRTALSTKAALVDTPDRTKQEILLLLEFINSKAGLQNTIKEHDEHVANGKVTFNLLWTIFSPREVICSFNREAAVEECYIVQKMEYVSEQGSPKLRLTVLAAYHDGHSFGIIKGLFD